MGPNDSDTPFIPDDATPPLDHESQRTVDHESGQRATVPGVIPSERGRLRAGDADRDQAVEFLNAAFGEGRLSKDEYDERLEKALSARTYADLDLLVGDLPAAQPAVVPAVADATGPPVAKTNALAMASFACGLAQFVFGPLGTIPAIIFGHMARNQIKRTGEQGAGLALGGLILGWGAVALGIVLMIVAIATIRMQPLPPPSFPPPP
jgi:hypothetical protein